MSDDERAGRAGESWRRWPGQLSSDSTVEGRWVQTAALGNGCRHNTRGVRRAGRMLWGLLAATLVVAAAVVLLVLLA